MVIPAQAKMPAAARKRKVSSNDEQDEEHPAPKRTAQSKRRAPARSKKQVDQEDSIDEGRTLSRDFFEAAKRSDKRPNALQAKEDVNTKVQEVLDLIDQTRDDLSRLTTPKVATLDQLLADALPTDGAKLGHTLGLSSTIQDGKDVFRGAQRSLKSFKKMVERYSAANIRDMGIKKPTWMRWKSDTSDLRELNESATNTTAQILHGIVVPAACRDTMPPSAARDDIQEVAWDMLAESRSKSKEDNWGALAQDILKVASSAARLLPN
ncbi:hypothetical protein B0I35DRAFT_428424 [Stachybotrys elegans]|uniref:Uncharacterized protein n=1 Tax=Stachybotrys elegans TaxID=80388 RepID=A0A8K0SQ71_9HYPO|nr:hypothetical protein B0I35DRAFT_428424 [Stachybotrys elegans]